MNDGALPAIDPNELGTLESVEIDALLIPYIIGALDFLTKKTTFNGDPEDIQGTIIAFEDLIATLTGV